MRALAALGVVLVACGGSTESSSTSSGGGASSSETGTKGASTFPNTPRPCGPADEEPKGACTAEGDRCAVPTTVGPGFCDTHPKSDGYPIYDQKVECTCSGGEWSCHITKPGGFAVGVCPKATLPDRKSCVSGSECGVSCAPSEDCFTQILCGLDAPDAASTACEGRPGPGDNKCHPRCTKDTECPSGQTCVGVDYFGCQDFNGNAGGGAHLKKICCAPGECE